MDSPLFVGNVFQFARQVGTYTLLDPTVCFSDLQVTILILIFGCNSMTLPSQVHI